MVCSPLQADLARAQFKLPRIPSMRLPKIIPERIGTDELGLTRRASVLSKALLKERVVKSVSLGSSQSITLDSSVMRGSFCGGKACYRSRRASGNLVGQGATTHEPDTTMSGLVSLNGFNLPLNPSTNSIKARRGCLVKSDGMTVASRFWDAPAGGERAFVPVPKSKETDTKYILPNQRGQRHRALKSAVQILSI
jgi:hypothetical protein